MRTIKFRGKSNQPESWRYGTFVYGSLITRGNLDPLINVDDNKFPVDVIVDPKTVGQFTGLYDKNGKEIYEGDILTWRSIICEEDPVETWELLVTFYNGCFCLNDDFDMTLISVIYDSEEFGGVKIVGNIHDTKLEDKE